MIDLRIKIGDDGDILDASESYGLIYLQSDKRLAAPEKPRDTSSYFSDPVEHVDRRAILAPFDFTLTLLVSAPDFDLESANARIRQFNQAIRQSSAQGDTCRDITLYSDARRFKIRGIPELLDEAEMFYRRADQSIMDCVTTKLKLRVYDPAMADFDKVRRTEQYTLRQFQHRWFGATTRPDGTPYLYIAVDGYRGRMMSCATRVSPGDSVSLRTYVFGEVAPAYAIVNSLQDRTVLQSQRDPDKISSYDFTASVGGVLIVNTDARKFSQSETLLSINRIEN